MPDGFYFIRHGSYNEVGPFRFWAEAYDAGVEATWQSTDFIIQRWLDGNMVQEWRDVSNGLAP